MNEIQKPIEQPETRPSIGAHLNFLRANRGAFNKMTPEKQAEIEQSFAIKLASSTPERQDGVRQTLNGIISDIDEPPQLQPGITYVRTLAIGDRIVDTLEGCGVVDSAIKDGVTHTRQDLSTKVDPESLLGELDYYEKDIKQTQSRHRGNKDFEETARLLLAIETGIRQELDRLQLINRDTKPAIIPDENYTPRYLPAFSGLLKANTLQYGLIGFSTLTHLIDEFYNVQRYSRIGGGWI